MKYNKRENQAIDTLAKIASAFKNKKEILLSCSDENSLVEVFGINLHKITKTKKHVKKMVNGKGIPIIHITGQLQQTSMHGGKIARHCYFPFQVKE